jgi:hypothetical protein
MSSLLFNYFLALFGRGKDYTILSPCSRIGHKHSRIFLKKKFAIWAKVSYVVSMLRKNDIVTNRQGRIFQVVGFGQSQSMGGDVVLCRLYRSQARFVFKHSQLRKHPLFS